MTNIKIYKKAHQSVRFLFAQNNCQPQKKTSNNACLLELFRICSERMERNSEQVEFTPTVSVSGDKPVRAFRAQGRSPKSDYKKKTSKKMLVFWSW